MTYHVESKTVNALDSQWTRASKEDYDTVEQAVQAIAELCRSDYYWHEEGQRAYKVANND